MAVSLGNQSECVNFFQQAVLRAVHYWQNHDAVRQIDVPVLDREHETIVSSMTRSLDFDPAWPVTRALIPAFASYMERRGHWEAWRILLERAIAMAQRVEDVDGETTMTALLARLSQRQSRPDDVVRYYRRAIRLAKKSGNRFEEARACSNLGYAFIDRGHWWRAEVLSKHALALFEQLGSEHGLAHTHNHLGLLYTRQLRWDDARTNLESSCLLWDTKGDQHSVILSYINLANLHSKMKQPERALQYLSDAAQIAKETGERSQMARIWNNMSQAYLISEKWPEAEKYATKAEALFKENSDYRELAYVWNNLGLIFAHCGNIASAIEYFEKSLNMYRVFNDHAGEMEVIKDMKWSQSFAEG